MGQEQDAETSHLELQGEAGKANLKWHASLKSLPPVTTSPNKTTPPKPLKQLPQLRMGGKYSNAQDYGVHITESTTAFIHKTDKDCRL